MTLFLHLPVTSTKICLLCFKNKVLQLYTDLYSVLQLHIDIKAQMLLIVIVPIPYCSVVRHHTTKKKKNKRKRKQQLLSIPHYSKLYNCLFVNSLNQGFCVMNPHYNELISPIPRHFVKSRFHCIAFKIQLLDMSLLVNWLRYFFTIKKQLITC